ncbi:MAG TPA: FtsX-like permease family protein, partial [Micromonosporaceae bacterium]
SRIPPVAALQEVATPDRPLTKVSVAGSLIGAVGATMLGYGLSGRAHGNTLWLILGGVLVSFIGVALLTPLIAKPVVSALGRLFSWSVPGKLGRLNSGRNPRRTAITAAALMVGIALVTGVNVILDSARTSISGAVQSIDAQLIVAGVQTGPRPPTFDGAVIDKAAAIPGVRNAVGLYHDRALVNGHGALVEAATDAGVLPDVYGGTAVAGSIGTLRPDQVIVSQGAATAQNLSVGQKITVQLSRGQPHTYTVGGIAPDENAVGSYLLPREAVGDFAIPQPYLAFVQVADGTPVASVKPQLDALVADSPEVSVIDQAAFTEQQTSGLDQILLMIQILLALAILIAILGIVNTLALSVIERTREIGLLRAIGLGRAQTMRMVTVESVVISVFGALLGVAVGTGLGAAVVRALRDEGVTDLTLPWSQMGVYIGLSAVIGVVAAVLPSIRAARLNVLAAIAHE